MTERSKVKVDKAIEALLNSDADSIDAIRDDSVLVAAIAKIESSGGIPRQALHTLDTVYQARLIDVAQHGTKAEEAIAFARHLNAMANDSRAESLAEFIHKWRAYADTAVLVARMRAPALYAKTTCEHMVRILDLVMSNSVDGILWDDLLSEASNVGVKTEAFMVHKVSALRELGYVNTVKTGTSVRVFLGPVGLGARDYQQSLRDQLQQEQYRSARLREHLERALKTLTPNGDSAEVIAPKGALAVESPSQTGSPRRWASATRPARLGALCRIGSEDPPE